MGFLLVHENYANMFPSVTSTEIPKRIRIESTKYSKVLWIGGKQLVKMFLDSVSTYITLFAIIYFIYIFFNVKMNMHWNITLFFQVKWANTFPT
jgi:hypothetical protein